MADPRHLSIIVVPDGAGDESRTYRVTYGRLRLLAVLGAALGLVVALMVGSWWYLAARAVRASALEEEVARMEAEQSRVAGLVARLEELEERYTALRSLFGLDSVPVPGELWLPPAGAPSGAPAPDTESRIPTSWPLSVAGFLTQPLLAGASGEHPGIDIAVPEDSYVRAAGAAEVVDVGEDEVYGRYVVLDHGNGYRTRYAHASRIFVETGGSVRRSEVIALSGSTGRSTAPHLHFEVLLNGEAVDPLTLVRRP